MFLLVFSFVECVSLARDWRSGDNKSYGHHVHFHRVALQEICCVCIQKILYIDQSEIYWKISYRITLRQQLVQGIRPFQLICTATRLV
jgi:hypothetical protein